MTKTCNRKCINLYKIWSGRIVGGFHTHWNIEKQMVAFLTEFFKLKKLLGPEDKIKIISNRRIWSNFENDFVVNNYHECKPKINKSLKT